jgi:ubiquinone biosynthesis protein
MMAVIDAFVQGDSRGVANVFTSLGVISRHTDLALLRLDIDRLVARYNPHGVAKFSLSHSMEELLGLMIKHKVRVPSAFASLLRALITAEGVSLLIDPSFDESEIALEVARRMRRDTLRPESLWQSMQDQGREWVHYLREIPRQVSDLLLRTQVGGNRLQIELLKIDKPLHRLDIMVNRLVFAIVVAALIMASTNILTSESSATGAVNTVAWVTTVFSILMGVWLLYSVIRSGRL